MTTTSNNLNDLVGNADALDWAKAFVNIIKENPSIASDEEAMLGWFANAIMAGYDQSSKRIIRSELAKTQHYPKKVLSFAKALVTGMTANPNFPHDVESLIRWVSDAIILGISEGINSTENKPIRQNSFEEILKDKLDLIQEIEATEKQLRQTLSVACKSGSTNTVSALTKSLQSLSDAGTFTHAEILEYSNIISNPLNTEVNHVRQG